MKQLLAIFTALALLMLGSAAAQAQTGSPAWSLRTLKIFEGPGHEYQFLGEIQPATRVYVDRCSKLWCRVHAKGEAAGWTKLYDLTFGRLEPIRYKGGGPGTVCLYEGANFTGEALCAKPGFRARDLLLLNADNRFSSVSIEGNVSVMLCRDRHFVNYCEHINTSQSHLHGFLNNNVTSVRVY